MDYIETQRTLDDLTRQVIDYSHKYHDARMRFGKASKAIMVLLVPKQKEPAYQKISMEKQILRLMSDSPEDHKEEVYGYFREYKESREEYKGLEKIIDAYSSKIMTIQSLMRWERENA